MELPGSAYMYTLASLSLTFVGFSGIVIVLRQTAGKELSARRPAKSYQPDGRQRAIRVAHHFDAPLHGVRLLSGGVLHLPSLLAGRTVKSTEGGPAILSRAREFLTEVCNRFKIAEPINTMLKPTVWPRQKFLQRYSPLHASTHVENVARTGS